MLEKKIAKLKRFVLKVMENEESPSPDSWANGEEKYLARIAREPIRAESSTIIDVGANVGLWTQKATELFQGTSIRSYHCIEPIQRFADQIIMRFEGRNDCIVHQILLSDQQAKQVPIYQIGGGGRMQPPKDYKSTLDSYMSKKPVYEYHADQMTGDQLVGIIGEKPHFIKIDCDGHDWFVLSGFRETLRQARPFVQFEYCDFWLSQGARLREACELLEGLGYATFIIQPTQLKRFRYSSLRETYAYMNIAAIPKEIPRLLADYIPI